MPSPQTVELRAAGLFLSPNRFRLPPGALLRAQNVSISREGVISRRRGFSRSAALTNPASALAEYRSTLLALDGTALKTYIAGVWAALAGAFAPPAGRRMSFLEANQNLYFTTSAGIFTVDSLTGTPRAAGTPAGLDHQLAKTGTGGSWFLPDSRVGYRHTWLHEDANDNRKQGEPSQQETLTNSYTAATWARAGTTATITQTAHGYATSDLIEILLSSDPAAITNGQKTITVTGVDTYTFACLNAGTASGTLSAGKRHDTTITVTLPDEIAAGDTLEIWRTALSAGDDEAPGDDHRLILSHVITSANVSAGFVTLTDDSPDEFFKDNLYTNQGLETLSQANARPPRASFIVTYQDHAFYFDTAQPHEITLQLLEVAGLIDNTSSITLAGRTYTFSTAEDQPTLKFQRFTAGTAAQNVANTMKSLQKILNRDPSATIIARYISDENSAPGRLRLSAKTPGTSSFALTADAGTTGDNFDPILPTSGTTISSTNNAKPNAASRSKAGAPESVPILNFHVFGAANKPIIGVVALREGILIFKDDGLFALVGQSDGSGGFEFAVKDLDPTVHLTAARSLALLGNAAIGYTTQGVLRAGQGPAASLSDPAIDAELDRISGLSAFATAHGIAYESENLYLLFTPETNTDTVPTIAYVYDTSIAGWTLWRKSVTAGLVLSADDSLYLAHATEPYVLVERKTFSTSGADYADEDIPVTITNVTTALDSSGRTVSQVTLTYTYTGESLTNGFGLIQGNITATIESVTQSAPQTFICTLQSLHSSLANGAASVTLPVPLIVEWAPITGGTPSTLKQIPYIQLFLERSDGHHQLGFQADTKQTLQFIDTQIRRRTAGWGSGPWGSFGWGQGRAAPSTPIRTFVPINHQLCRGLSVQYRNAFVRESVDILCLAADLRLVSTATERQP